MQFPCQHLKEGKILRVGLETKNSDAPIWTQGRGLKIEKIENFESRFLSQGRLYLYFKGHSVKEGKILRLGLETKNSDEAIWAKNFFRKCRKIEKIEKLKKGKEISFKSTGGSKNDF